MAHVYQIRVVTAVQVNLLRVARVCAGMLLNPNDKSHVSLDALRFASEHALAKKKFGVDFRRSDIVAAAERSADQLPPEGRSDEREIAVLWCFATQVFHHLGIDVRLA